MRYLVRIFNILTQKVTHVEPFYYEFELNNYIKSCRLQEYETILIREISTYDVTNYLYDRETGSYTKIV